MDTKALKDKILQLAIQGKLVPQDENDEPASVLLERIKEEKEQLIKDKVVKKEKPLLEISEDEKLFELPNGWELCRLGEIFNIKSTKRVYERDYVDKGIPFYRSKEIGILSEGNNIEDNYYISNDLYIELKNKYGAPKLGDLLITSVGTIGKCWISDGREFYYKDGNITQLDNNTFVNMEYIRQFINSSLFLEQVGKTVNGTAYNALTIIKLKNMILALPPLKEQNRIVAKVEALFKLIDELDNNKEALLQNISDSRNKILQLAIQGKLVSQDENDEHASVLLEKIKEEKEQLIKDKVIKKEKLLLEISDDEKLFDLPNWWEWTRLGEIIQLVSGRDVSSNLCNDNGIGTPYIMGASNMTNNGISIERWIENPTVIGKADDVMISVKGTVGKVAILQLKEVHLSRQVMSLRCMNGLSNRYLLIFLQYFMSELQNKSTGVIPGISRDDILNIPIPIPPREEQNRIVFKITSIMNYFDELEKQLN